MGQPDMTKVTTETKGDYQDAHEAKRLTLSDGNGHSSQWKPVDRVMDRVKRYSGTVVAVFAMCAAIWGSVMWAHGLATAALVRKMESIEATLGTMAAKQDVADLAAVLDRMDRQRWVVPLATDMEWERAKLNPTYIPIPRDRIQEIHDDRISQP
jgi:hypothetical protein